MWVGFKAISETVESGASAELAADRAFVQPGFTAPPGGPHYRWPDLPGPQIEERMEAKKHAVFAFAEANPIDRRIHDVPDAHYDNTERPHSALGYQTPAAFAERLITATDRHAALREGYAQRPVALPALEGVSTERTPVQAG